MLHRELTDDERNLLQWLSEEDTSQYGECYGPTLDSLITLRLVKLHGIESEYYNDFLAKRPIREKPNIMFRAVSVTEIGFEELRKWRK